MEILQLHHVSLPVTDLERSRRFYREVLGLEEIERPPFPFPGAWFRLGDRELHLIAGESVDAQGGRHGPAPAALRGPGAELPAGAGAPAGAMAIARMRGEGDPVHRAGAAPVGGRLPAALRPRPRPAPDRDQRRAARFLIVADAAPGVDPGE